MGSIRDWARGSHPGLGSPSGKRWGLGVGRGSPEHTGTAGEGPQTQRETPWESLPAGLCPLPRSPGMCPLILPGSSKDSLICHTGGISYATLTPGAPSKRGPFDVPGHCSSRSTELLGGSRRWMDTPGSSRASNELMRLQTDPQFTAAGSSSS